MKVSFDFDGTLDKPSMQEYARELIAKGVDVYIVTGRLSDANAPAEGYNDDLYDIAAYVGIERKRIRFMDFVEKYHYFRNRNFVWHIDDHWTTVGLINRFTNTRGITLSARNNWRKECNEELARKREFIHPAKKKIYFKPPNCS